jgi:hypothetical protein
MRLLSLVLLMLLPAGCKDRTDFDARYNATARTLNNDAAAIDSGIADRVATDEASNNTPDAGPE